MSVTQALLEGLKVTVVGLTIVFAVLIILMIVLMLMKVIFAKEPKKQAAVQEVKPAPAAPVQSAAEDDIDDEELIAVLTAAIAASLNTSTYNLQIKSYRRIGNGSPAWNQAGLRDTIDSRF